MDSGAQMEFVAERLRGVEIARFDVTDKSGKVVVPKDKRITVRRHRELEQSGTMHISVPEDFLVGRVVARSIVDADTGEILAKANDELTEALLKKSAHGRRPGVAGASTPTNWTRAPYISRDAAHRRDVDEFAARVAIYRTTRPASRPRKTRCRRCSSACSTTRTRTTCRAWGG